jgi:hypothetical protein
VPGDAAPARTRQVTSRGRRVCPALRPIGVR